MMAARHRATYVHLRHVAIYSTQIARYLALPGPEVERIRTGALLHDIGKMAVPEAVLYKPSRLTDEEARLVREHPRVGAEMLARLGVDPECVAAVQAHHEWYDGSGYPGGLAGARIPFGARIVSVADAFDTMTTPRAYRRILPVSEAALEVRRHSGTQFDPRVVQAFLHLLENSPVNRLPWFDRRVVDYHLGEPLALRFAQREATGLR
jgi:putative nucleotidyltransferase with HDIG domain